MSDSPIESTKGLHESKERKPERCTSNLCRMNGCMFPQSCPISTVSHEEHRENRLIDRVRESLNAGGVGLSRGAEPEPDCDCEGLWNDSTIRMDEETRRFYNRTGHLLNCPRYGRPFGFTREDVELLRDGRIHMDNCNSFHEWHGECDCDARQRASRLADRIEALLPPEDK